MGPKVYEYDLHWAIWSLRLSKKDNQIERPRLLQPRRGRGMRALG